MKRALTLLILTSLHCVCVFAETKVNLRVYEANHINQNTPLYAKYRSFMLNYRVGIVEDRYRFLNYLIQGEQALTFGTLDGEYKSMESVIIYKPHESKHYIYNLKKDFNRPYNMKPPKWFLQFKEEKEVILYRRPLKILKGSNGQIKAIAIFEKDKRNLFEKPEINEINKHVTDGLFNYFSIGHDIDLSKYGVLQTLLLYDGRKKVNEASLIGIRLGGDNLQAFSPGATIVTTEESDKSPKSEDKKAPKTK